MPSLLTIALLIVLLALFIGVLLIAAWIIDQFFPGPLAVPAKIIVGAVALYGLVVWISAHSGLLHR